MKKLTIDEKEKYKNERLLYLDPKSKVPYITNDWYDIGDCSIIFCPEYNNMIKDFKFSLFNDGFKKASYLIGEK